MESFTFSLEQLKEMKLIPVSDANNLVKILQNPQTKEILNLSLTPDIQITLDRLSEQSMEVIAFEERQRNP